MVRQHNQLNGHEFEQTLGDGEGQESLTSCNPWDREESDSTQQLTTKLCSLSTNNRGLWCFCLADRKIVTLWLQCFQQLIAEHLLIMQNRLQRAYSIELINTKCHQPIRSLLSYCGEIAMGHTRQSRLPSHFSSVLLHLPPVTAVRSTLDQRGHRHGFSLHPHAYLFPGPFQCPFRPCIFKYDLWTRRARITEDAY